MPATTQALLSSFGGGAAPAPISLIQQKVGSAADGSSPVTVTFDAPVTDGNSVLVQIAFDPSKASFFPPPTMVGGGAQPLSQGIANEAGNNIWIYNYWIGGGSIDGGETGVTFTLDTAVPVAVNASEWHGLADAGPEATDVQAGSSDTPNTGLLGPSSTNNLCIASYATVADNYQSGPTDGWTRLTPANVTGIFLETAYLIQTTADATSTSWGLDSSVDWSSIGCVFGH